MAREQGLLLLGVARQGGRPLQLLPRLVQTAQPGQQVGPDGVQRVVAVEPGDVVDACVAASADDPYDVQLRAAALGKIDENLRTSAGEVFKRAANIAKEAPPGELVPPASVQTEVHPSEQRVFDAYQTLKQALGGGTTAADYERALTAIATFAPVLAQFFEDIFVMVEELPLRNNRLRLMRETHVACSRFANFNLLVKA